MKNITYWVVISLVLIGGLFVTVYFGLQPRTVTKITLAEYPSQDILADSILSQLHEEIKQYPIVILGVEPEVPEQMQIWNHFLQSPENKFDHMLIDQFIKTGDLFPKAERTDTRDNVTQIIQVLTDLQAKGQRVVILLPTVYSSQLIAGNVASILKEEGHLKVLSISLADFPRSREEEKTMHFPCSVEDVDQTGLGQLGCAIAQGARNNYHDPKTKGSWVGVMDQTSESDYLVMFTREH